MTPGRLIILEGPDGAGKSTTSRLLAERLRADGRAVSCFAFPGNEPGTLGKLVHDLHHAPKVHGVSQIDATGLQVLHAAAHVDAIRTRIRPAYERGDTVIMDRYWWSTIVYGRVAGVDATTLNLLWQLAEHHWGFAAPTAAYLLMGPSRGANASNDDSSRLRSAYSEFVESLGLTFPVHVLHDDGSRADYSELILGGLAAQRPTLSA
jgi:thymidylate kinase